VDDFIAANRLNWDDRAKLHATDATGFYGIERVLAGGDSLHAIEAGEIGDIVGKRLVHLQCHIGLDTISLAGRGAVATGLDFSPEAIAAARDLAARAGRDVRFVQADVYDAHAALGETYEVAYVSWGTITWLPDIARWARVVADVLEPGGFLYFADSHPSAAALEQIDGRLVPHYAWRTPRDQPLVFDDAVTYTQDPRPLTHRRNYCWIHPLSDILNALAAGGLALEWLHEHERLTYPLFPMMVPANEPSLFRLPDGMPPFPLSFSLKAVKRA
jgi:SAM-dependent methyltransferase